MSNYTSEQEKDIQRAARQLAAWKQQQDGVPLSRTVSMLTVATSNLTVDDRNGGHGMVQNVPINNPQAQIIEVANPNLPAPVEEQNWEMDVVPESDVMMVDDQEALHPMEQLVPANVLHAPGHVAAEVDYGLEIAEGEVLAELQAIRQVPYRYYICHRCLGQDHVIQNCPTRAIEPVTPYQGSKRCIGVFYCQGCNHEWTNRNSRANTSQLCRRCNAAVYPHKQHRIPVMTDEKEMPTFVQFKGFQ